MKIALNLHTFTPEELAVAVAELRELAAYHHDHWPLVGRFLDGLALACNLYPRMAILVADGLCPPDLHPAVRDQNYAFLSRLAEQTRWSTHFAQPTRRVLGAVALAVRDAETARDADWRAWQRFAYGIGAPTATSRLGGPEDEP